METSGWIWPNFKLIQVFMHVLIACKYEKDQTKNSRCQFLHYKSMGFLSDAHRNLQVWNESNQKR